jgi:hypothetical protein
MEGVFAVHERGTHGASLGSSRFGAATDVAGVEQAEP